MIERGPLAARCLTAPGVAQLRHDLVTSAVPTEDAERISLLRELEQLKAAIAAVQAQVSVDFDTSQRAAQRAHGTPAAQVGRGVAAQLALARRESPHAGDRLLGLAKAVVHEMPHTLRALREGVLTEFRAMLMVRETACLSLGDRAAVDAHVAGDPDRVSALGNRQLVAECRRIAYRLDPQAVVRRAEQAASDRCVSLRPAPDAMAWLTALLPLAQGVAAYVALRSVADGATAAGDGRGRGQVMADTLVERLTGQASAAAVPVGVHLIMTDQTLFGRDPAPAEISGYGPVPAAIARALVVAAPEASAWVRRLYTDPHSGELVAMESRARLFPEGLASLITVRDQTCRTPWCDAPIRHSDHVVPHAEGGPTSFANGQGLCEACNHAKQAPGWAARTDPGGAGIVELQTPTGHRYRSRPPRPPGREPAPDPAPALGFPTGMASPIELHFHRLLVAA